MGICKGQQGEYTKSLESLSCTDINQPNFNVTTLCPPMVYGPMLHWVRDVKSLNTSSEDIYRLFSGSLKEVPDTSFWAFVDVRDGKLVTGHHLSGDLD